MGQHHLHLGGTRDARPSTPIAARSRRRASSPTYTTPSAPAARTAGPTSQHVRIGLSRDGGSKRAALGSRALRRERPLVSVRVKRAVSDDNRCISSSCRARLLTLNARRHDHPSVTGRPLNPQENVVVRGCLELSRPMICGTSSSRRHWRPLPTALTPPPRPDLDRTTTPGSPLGNIWNGRNRSDEPRRHSVDTADLASSNRVAVTHSCESACLPLDRRG